MEHHSFSTEYGKNPLFAAIILRDENLMKTLKTRGETFSEELKNLLVNGSGSLVGSSPDASFMLNYIVDLGSMTAEEFLFIIPRLHEEAGAPLYFTNSMINGIFEYKGFEELLFDARVLECFLNCFDIKKINKKKFMTRFINIDRADLLALCAERGWLGSVKKCDELTELSNDIQSAECTAFLLDFKNRNFDLAAEREKADKKAMRELNAAPGSMTALKALWCWKKREDGGLTVTRYKGTAAEVTVPEKIGNDTVTEIGMAFSPIAGAITPKMSEFRKTVTRITLPETVTKIADYAFAHCEGLEYVNIPAAVTRIGRGAFKGCDKLCAADIPNGVCEIYEETFAKCASLVSVRIPESVKKISVKAFSECEDLEEVTLPSGLTGLGEDAFSSCVSLKEIELPSGITKIPTFCFHCCCGLVRAVIPSGVTEISRGAFGICYSLTRIDIPDTVVSVGDAAFAGCSSLETLVIPEGVKNIGIQAFANCQDLKRAELPRSLENIDVISFETTGKPRTIFDKCPNVTAVVYPESRAEEYCKRYNIPFVYYDDDIAARK